MINFIDFPTLKGGAIQVGQFRWGNSGGAIQVGQFRWAIQMGN